MESKNKLAASATHERSAPMSYVYDASAIEVLSGLEPVRKRPGMFTDTSRPNHLAQEVIDNSVDEAIAGYARAIEVTLYRDGSLAVKDDGRGMPVDLHPEEQVPGGSNPDAAACRWQIFAEKLPLLGWTARRRGIGSERARHVWRCGSAVVVRNITWRLPMATRSLSWKW